MRILVTGAGGILGGAVTRMSALEGRDVVPSVGRPTGDRTQVVLDVRDAVAVDRAVVRHRVDAIVNCAGLTKARCVDSADAVAVNAVAPRALAAVASWRGVRLVHVSTDCVFDGAVGPYDERCPATATDLYGRTKALGERCGQEALVVRTSFVGWEREGGHGLLAWLAAQRGDVVGYTDHLWSGLCAPTLASILIDLAARPEVVGLLHVAGASTTKAGLLQELVGGLRLDVRVRPSPSGRPVDRRLVSLRGNETGVRVPPMDRMIEALREDRVRWAGSAAR